MQNNIATNDILLFMTVGIAVILLLTMAFVLFFHFSQKNLQTEKLKLQSLQIAHQNQLLNASILTQEKERKRIAKDLHDSVGSKLNVMLLSLHRLKKLATADPKAATTIHDTLTLLNDTVGTTRRIAHDLLPPTLERFGLVAAIQELCDNYSKTDAIDVQFDLTETTPKPIDKTVALHLFRVLQELMLNSIRHGKASQISLRLTQLSATVQLDYQDNGNGFDTTHIAHQKGLGMQNIESRLKIINAIWTLDSKVGAGVQVQIKLNENDQQFT